MPDKPVKLLQITDCHLGENRHDPLLSMSPDESLVDVIALIQQQHGRSDLLIATGDLVNRPSLSAYQRLHHHLENDIDAPFAWLPGNHDDPALMASLGEEVNCKVHVLGHWLIVLLDSRVAGKTHGNFTDTELEFLKDTLEAHSDKHIMVCLHHQPVPIGSAWMDRYIVQNASEFWSIIDKSNAVKMVVWGHVHQQFDEIYAHSGGDIALLAAPSTCIQFTPGKKEFTVENSMPGYRWFELYDDGRFTTSVERINRKDYGIDFNSHGY